jgi:hypothetical protein
MFVTNLKESPVHMSANDVLSANAQFEEWSKTRAAGLKQKGINKFEYFCVDQFLKSYPIADEEILSGITGGKNDGGVDAIYFFANRKIVDDETQVSTDTTLRVNLRSSKSKKIQGSVRLKSTNCTSLRTIC